MNSQQRRDSHRALKQASINRKKEANERRNSERQARKEQKEEAKRLKKLGRVDDPQSRTGSRTHSLIRVGSRHEQEDELQLMAAEEEVGMRTDQEQGEFDDFLEQPRDSGSYDAVANGTRPDSGGSTLVSLPTR